MTSSRHFAVGVAVVRMRRRGVAGKVDTDDAQPDLAAPRARRAEVLPNEGATTHGHPPWSIDSLGSFPGEKTDWRDNPAAGPGPPPSGTWPVRIRLDRVAHRPVFLRISRW